MEMAIVVFVSLTRAANSEVVKVFFWFFVLQLLFCVLSMQDVTYY